MDGFHGSLDPRAQEFIPRITCQFTLVQPHVYFPYPSSHHVPSTLYFTPPSPPLHAPPPPPQPPLMVLPPPPTTTFSATRSLLISLVPREVNEEVLRGELGVFGEIRGVEMQRLIQEGNVIVHFFDVRHAQSALAELQGKHIQLQSKLTQGQHYQPNNTINPFFVPSPSWVIENKSTSVVHRHVLPHYQPGLIAGRTVWAEFTLPTMITSCLVDGHNQGTIVLFNLVISVSTAQLKAIFQVFGPIKELRETPSKRQQRFIEFFDIRDAAKALHEMNGKEINGQTVVIEFSRPGGTRRRLASMNHSINSFYTRPTNYPQMQHELGKDFDSCIPMNNQRENSGGGGLEVSMSTLRVGGVDKNERNTSAASSSSKKGKKIKDSSAGTTKQQAGNHKRLQPRSSTSRQWKGKQRTSDVKYLIHDDAVVESSSSFIKDARTTVMIKNIPNKYSQKLVLNMLDNHCIRCNEKIFAEGDENQPLSAYDFVYLPIDFNNKCNVGYGFVNLTTPQAAWRLYKAFHLQQWEVFNSRKICEVTYARLQGLAELTEHFNNSKFACDKDDYLPVIFSPPRDGKQLTDPIAVGKAQANSASSDNVPVKHRLQTSPSGKEVMVNNLKGRDDKLEEDDHISGGSHSCTGSLIKNCNSNDDDGRKKNIALMINKEDEVIVYDKKCNTSSNGTKSTTSYCGSSSLVSALPSSSAGKPNGCMSSSVSRQKPKDFVFSRKKDTTRI
ncbi:hypothetical protein C5167_023312 [Papaver somniferum]|uniref:RRM domain-containing protein n=1 Tax=Papaver somniferum TaxID=3469 RepID=A0A4Y7JLC6_PAPSO|nr:hypothetical protein C5167_023312 [Papaver somniferum]